VGFTLVEMASAIVLIGLVLGAFMGVVLSVQRSYQRQRDALRAQDALRLAESVIRTALRGGGADPLQTGAPGIDPDPLGHGRFDNLRVVSDFNPADEAGAAHTLGVLRTGLRDSSATRLLRGSDGLPGTPDDGLLEGYALDTAIAIPAGGRSSTGGWYTVRLMDDPADADGDPSRDSNSFLLARCTGTTDDSASASVDVMIGSVPLPALAVDGRLVVSGNPAILGPCGGVHSNDTLVVSGVPTVATKVSSSDTVRVSGFIRDSAGTPRQPLHHQPPVEIPVLQAADYCAGATLVLRQDGFILSGGLLFDARNNDVFGWKRGSSSPVVWTLSGNAASAGVVCAKGNVVVSGNPGAPGAPLSMSILATGSIDISGNPYLTAAHPDGILFLAEGDLGISGNPSGSTDNYSGLMYARSQCKLNGNPNLSGQVLCKSDPDGPGDREITAEASVSGNATLRYDCGGRAWGQRRVLSWYQRFGA
jgi:type II secretory pathway pseudopilin PulG